MNTSWKPSAFSKNTTPVSVDEALMDEKGVILLQGRNIYGDMIFTYLEISLRSMIQMREKIRRQEDFMPAEYGTVLAAGKGEPSPELKSEMAVTHNMIDVPKPKPQASQTFAVPQPKLWDD